MLLSDVCYGCVGIVAQAFAKMIPPGDTKEVFEEKVIKHVQDACKRRKVRLANSRAVPCTCDDSCLGCYHSCLIGRT